MFDHALIIGAMLFVAYANGANDNFKGVATLFGSGISSYRKALWWATLTTLAGSAAAMLLATRLIAVFQGEGLVPDTVAQSPGFLGAAILGAAVTVMASARIGMPISTTHSLTGALVGGAIAAGGFNLSLDTLAQSFFLPLLVSPLMAVALSLILVPFSRAFFRLAGMNRATCFCVASEIMPVMATPEGCVLSNRASPLRVIIDQEPQCEQRVAGNLFGVNIHTLVDYGHFLSAGAVSFARGLNDTPKIVALGLAAGELGTEWSIGFVAVAMAAGGLVSARRVAETVSKRITAMEPDQGFLANLVTSFLVICASAWGMPVSTTHVSCGALFGIGVARGGAHWATIRAIVLAWFLTLPFAAASAGVLYTVLARLS